MRTLAPLAACLFATPLAAQLPQPKLPATPTLEVVTLRSIDYQASPQSLARYERAGTRPIHYRMGGDATLAGAVWRTFTEGPTTSTVEGSTTWIRGSITPPSGATATTGASCSGGVVVKTYLQFRIRNATGQYLNSAIRGDSACLQIGG